MNVNDFMAFYQMIDKYKDLLTNNELSKNDIDDIKRQLGYFEFLENKMSELRCDLGRILDYYNLLEKGFSKVDISNFILEDDAYINECKKRFKEINNLKNKMFGYPYNMASDSFVTNYLRFLESKLLFLNSNNKIEEEIVKKLRDNLHLDSSYCGCITNDNLFGINLGLMKYPNAYLYCSSNNDYVLNDKKVIIDDINERIDTKKLFLEIERNYWDNKSPCVILLNYGTENLGSIDDIKLIKNYLVSRNIPHYIHVNASLYGGVSTNQEGMPLIDFHDLDIDSISINLHKYIGLHESREVILYKKIYNDKLAINRSDFPLFSTYQKVKESLYRSVKGEYLDNINYFEKLLNEKDIPYFKGNDKSNFFIIMKPSTDICTKYHLKVFSFNNLEYARIIIFPYHSKEIIEELVNDIKEEKVYKKV